MPARGRRKRRPRDQRQGAVVPHQGQRCRCASSPDGFGCPGRSRLATDDNKPLAAVRQSTRFIAICTLLAIAFVGLHVVTTVADGYAPIGLKDALVPFASPYRPIWLGLGAVAFDLLLALVVTSYLRHRIGVRLWRGAALAGVCRLAYCARAFVRHGQRPPDALAGAPGIRIPFHRGGRRSVPGRSRRRRHSSASRGRRRSNCSAASRVPLVARRPRPEWMGEARRDADEAHRFASPRCEQDRAHECNTGHGSDVVRLAAHRFDSASAWV